MLGIFVNDKKWKGFGELVEKGRQLGTRVVRVQNKKDLQHCSVLLWKTKLLHCSKEQELEECASGRTDLIHLDHWQAARVVFDRLKTFQSCAFIQDLPEKYKVVPTLSISEFGLRLKKQGPVAIGEINYPVIAKCRGLSDSVSDHRMIIIFNDSQLINHTSHDLIIQPFVNHDGAMMKIEVLGKNVFVSSRNSISDQKSLESAEIVFHEKISVATKTDEVGTMGDDGVKEGFSRRCLRELLTEIDVGGVVGSVAKQLSLSIFSIDLIRSVSDGGTMYIIDINYFPGFAAVISTLGLDYFQTVMLQHAQDALVFSRQVDMSLYGNSFEISKSFLLDIACRKDYTVTYLE